MTSSATLHTTLVAAGAIILLAISGCGDSNDTDNVAQTQSFSLRFAAVDGANEIDCSSTLTGLGASHADKAQISDLRFYVSNLQFFTPQGAQLAVTLDQNQFQYTDADGTVALIDLTGTSAGACAGTGISYPEGTARTNNVVKGSAAAGEISRVSFDVGIPQHLMKKIIASHTAEDAPSPLAEMHWSWAYAYRHFLLNFAVVDANGAPGEGYVHVGSVDCGGDGTKALTDRESCGKLNTPKVSLSGFTPATNTVAVNLRNLLANVDFSVEDTGTTGPGVVCHSSPDQPDCPILFANLGVDQASGVASAQLNSVFSSK